MNKAFFIFPLILFSLLVAIAAGWLRLGWSLPITAGAAHHGAVMTGSFLATLIFLERAVTFKNKGVLLLPFINGCSVLFFIADKPVLGQWCLIIGSAGFFLMCLYFLFRYKEFYYGVFLAGAFCLLAGFIQLYKEGSYPAAVHWWMLFLLFTIVAERLELTRFLPLSGVKKGWLLLSLVTAQVAVFLPFHTMGNTVLGLSFISTAVWLLLNDMARKSVRLKGQHQYSAVLLLTGYLWLFIAGLLFFSLSHPFLYDALLHSFFVGFVFAMIFSHAPIILPAVIKKPYKIYRPLLYIWFCILKLSLVLRVIGDLFNSLPLRKWGGLLNGIALICFFVTVIFTVLEESRKHKASAKS